MYRLAKWLWEKAERQTALIIMAMIESYFTHPGHKPASPTREELELWEYQNKAFTDSMRVCTMIQRRYFPGGKKKGVGDGQN